MICTQRVFVLVGYGNMQFYVHGYKHIVMATLLAYISSHIDPGIIIV